MRIRVEPSNGVVQNGAPFTLTTTIINCAPGVVTIWYKLPPGPANFVTPSGHAKVVSHSGLVPETSGIIKATLRVEAPTTPTTTDLEVIAEDSAGQVASDQITVKLV